MFSILEKKNTFRWTNSNEPGQTEKKSPKKSVIVRAAKRANSDVFLSEITNLKGRMQSETSKP